ncbi:TonB-dependent receptor [uncultured Erythrobacter sp.]|uniref:TonB-dependent receptor n=1 Tax=uncultured Erythrobacter sp. TaxID=263913 RepID=UPI002624BA30|nr:TonB-dependent receptor [uncultured Erythrobacter sp.]
MTRLHTRNAAGTRVLRRALLGSAAAATMIGMPSIASAQDNEVAEGADSNERVIIVQARRQDETLQEVPVTVTAIGGETLERYGVDQVADVVSRVPSLNVQVGGSGSGGQLSLRGVGSSNISSSFDSAVAFDFDGVQVSSMRLVQAGFFDTQQIDVLKGPQSLFFGKSASAGVFAIRSADPTPDWEIGGSAQYEFEEKGYTVGGYISGPITDNLGIRIAAQYNDIDEFLLLEPGTPTVHGDARSAKNFVGRVTLAYDDNDRFDANLKLQYVRNENDGAISHGDISCGANGVADDIVLLGGGLIINPGYDCNAFDQRQFLPDAAAAVSASIPTPSLAAGRNGVPFGETDIMFGRLLWNLDLSDSLTLTSTTGLLSLDATDYDCYSYGGIFAPGVPAGVGCSDPNNKLDQFSQELRLTSDLDGPFNFMVGAFYETRDFLFDTAELAANIAFVAPDPITGFTTDYDRRHETETEAVSFFGSVIFDITDDLELSGGIRYTDENKTQRISLPFVHAFLSGGGAFLSSGFFSGPIDFQDDNISPEVTLRYQAADDINIFASYKTGFKSGGVDNSALPTASLGAAAAAGDFSALIFESETAEGGEIGIKSQFSDRTLTLNATAYYYVFDNLQVQNFDAVAIQFSTLNAGEVTTAGVDLEWRWRTPVDGLSLSGNVAYLDAEFSDTFVTEQGFDLDGRQASRAPTWSGNAAFDWFIPVGDSLEFGLNGNVVYSGSYFTDESTPTDFRQDSYVTFDAAVSIGDPDGKWTLSVVGNNLADEIWVNTSGGRPFLPAGGDDLVLTQNRGRQVFAEVRFKF